MMRERLDIRIVLQSNYPDLLDRTIHHVVAILSKEDIQEADGGRFSGHFT